MLQPYRTNSVGQKKTTNSSTRWSLSRSVLLDFSAICSQILKGFIHNRIYDHSSIKAPNFNNKILRFELQIWFCMNPNVSTVFCELLSLCATKNNETSAKRYISSFSTQALRFQLPILCKSLFGILPII